MIQWLNHSLWIIWSNVFRFLNNTNFLSPSNFDVHGSGILHINAMYIAQIMHYDTYRIINELPKCANKQEKVCRECVLYQCLLLQHLCLPECLCVWYMCFTVEKVYFFSNHFFTKWVWTNYYFVANWNRNFEAGS